MRENICLQCNKSCFGPINRLVQDACGHRKCRTCLLTDEQQCTQCEAKNSSQNGFEKDVQLDSDVSKCDRNGETNNEVVLNNHTAVIQVNGGYPKVNSVLLTSNSIQENENEFIGTVQCKADEIENSLKIAEETEGNFKIKKPDKTQKKAHNSVDIPKHINVIKDPVSYHCTICDKHFATKIHVKYHYYCSGATKPFKCDVCQKEFILRAQLDVHSYKHKNSKPFSCSVCKKSFSVKSKLTRHSAVHSAIKSHICSICGSAYRSKESLKIHVIIHKGEKPYGCKLCPARFNNQSNLNKHVTTHSKEKTHMCDQCGKRFKQKWALSIHHRSHSRIRAHECGICHKSFVNLKDLQRHSFVHAGRQPIRNPTTGPETPSTTRLVQLASTSTRTPPRNSITEQHDKQIHQSQTPASSTDRLSSRLKRQLSRAATILTEISTTYQLLSTRKVHTTWQNQ